MPGVGRAPRKEDPAPGAAGRPRHTNLIAEAWGAWWTKRQAASAPEGFSLACGHPPAIIAPQVGVAARSAKLAAAAAPPGAPSAESAAARTERAQPRPPDLRPGTHNAARTGQGRADRHARRPNLRC